MKRIKNFFLLLFFSLSLFSITYANEQKDAFLNLSKAFNAKPEKRIELFDQLIRRQNRVVIKSLFKAKGNKKFYYLGLENAFTDLRFFNHVLTKELKPYIVEKYYLKNLSFWGLVFKKNKAFYSQVIKPNLDSYWGYPHKMRKVTYLSLKFLKSLRAKSGKVSKRKYKLVLKGYTDAFEYFNYLLKLLNQNISEKEMSNKFDVFAKKLSRKEKRLFITAVLQATQRVDLEKSQSKYKPKNRDEDLKLFGWKVLIRRSLGERGNRDDIIRPGHKRRKVTYDYLKYRIKSVKEIKRSKKFKHLYSWLLNHDRFFLATKMLFLR